MKSFNEVFEDKTKYGTKIKTSEYCEMGAHLIIDQGQEQVAGYTDIEEGVFEEVPVIIFGDHTRVIKYVDKPFFLGADGVKVLRSKFKNANYKYLYYALKNARIPNTGYNRHFKWLKEVQIEYPDYRRQENVVKILDKVSDLIETRQHEIKRLDDLIKARFVEMFGDSASNEKGWKMNTFGDICTVRQGLQIPISKRLTEYEEDSYEYITVQYLHGGKEKEYIKSPKESVKCTKDDILMTRTGNTGMVVTNVEGVFHNNFFLIDFDRERFEKDFLVEYLNLDLIQADITRRAGTSTIPDLNHGEFYKIKVFEPPIDLQKEFDEFKMQVDKSKFYKLLFQQGFYQSTRFNSCSTWSISVFFVAGIIYQQLTWKIFAHSTKYNVSIYGTASYRTSFLFAVKWKSL